MPHQVADYCHERGTTIRRNLGYGQDGSVWETSDRTAIKCFDREENFRREAACYERLAANGVTSISGCVLPEMIRFNQPRLLIEMEIVSPPYILDFGKAYIDDPPEFPAEIMAEHREIQREKWNMEDWKRVQMIVWELEQHGIYYLDTKPGNIKFRP